MAKITLELEKKVLTILPMITEWAKDEKKLTKAEVKAFKLVYPDIFEFIRNATIEEVAELAEKYKDYKIFGEYVKVFLSREGQEAIKYWMGLAENYERDNNLNQKK